MVKFTITKEVIKNYRWTLGVLLFITICLVISTLIINLWAIPNGKIEDDGSVEIGLNITTGIIGGTLFIFACFILGKINISK